MPSTRRLALASAVTKTFNSSLAAPGPSVPEAPLTIALPLVALLAIATGAGLRRRSLGRNAA